MFDGSMSSTPRSSRSQAAVPLGTGSDHANADLPSPARGSWGPSWRQPRPAAAPLRRRAHPWLCAPGFRRVDSVAKVAAREVPELAQKFLLKPGSTTYLAFRTTARGIAAEAQSQKHVLVKHGLVETVLDDLTQALEQFDAAMDSGAEGRAAQAVQNTTEARTRNALLHRMGGAARVIGKSACTRARQVPGRGRDRAVTAGLPGPA